MPRSLPLRLGCAYTFLYPRYNYTGLPMRQEIRRVLIEAVRDTQSEPIHEQTRNSNPLLNRGRTLITGFDLDRDATRSFYVESMSEIQLLAPADLEPFRHAEYLVMTIQGRTRCSTIRLSDAMDRLVEFGAGFLCRIIGRIDATESMTDD